MKKADRSHLEQRLLAERERAVKAVRQLDELARTSSTEDGDLTTYPLHLADEGTDAVEQEKSLLLLSQEGRLLLEIDEALRRLYREDEHFGRCAECGEPIGMERLDILPWARLCASCQTQAETAVEPTPAGQRPT